MATPTVDRDILDLFSSDDMLRASADLFAAANVVRRRGWTRGVFVDGPGGPVCLLGAVRVAIAGDEVARTASFCGGNEISDRYDAAFWALTTHLDATASAAGDADPVGPVLWNDTVCDGGPAAIAVLKAAARLCQRRAGG